MNYDYTKTNRLQEPHRYMYTGYFGESFLCAFFEDRLLFVPQKIRISYGNIDAELNRQIGTLVNKNSVLEKKPLSTEGQLLNLILDLSAGATPGEKLDRFVRIFEIKRNIYDYYDPAGKPEPSASYESLINYVLLSIGCGLAFRNNGNLKFINCHIKLNDLLSSCRKQIDHDALLVSLCMVAVLLEEHNVKALMKTSGVAL